MTLHALKNWEDGFAQAIQRIALPERTKAGVLLPVVPDHSQWDDYLSSIRTEWQSWRPTLRQHPSCLLVLYAGLAFYEYDENTFWPQFAESVGSDPLPANQQQEINNAFGKAAKYFGLRLKPRDNGTDFVGSAIHYVGIPLSLWDGFLEICEWALWRKDWQALSDQEWKEAVEKRSGGRRLRKFLTDNRETASNFVQEMLDAREILTKDTGLTIGNIAQASILRAEYFDEVPETAEFLRPQNPESLFQDRARLIWNEQRKQICLQLPGVELEKLPATWHVGEHSQPAARSPDELILNSEAFRDSLLLTLESGNHHETQRLRGVASWALFDMESGGRLINSDRDELPLKSYTVISLNEKEILREGFDEDENPVNEQFELADGTTCFVTRLWPTGKYAEVRLREANQSQRVIRFRARTRIEARFFVGRGHKAAYFSRMTDNKIKMDHLPVLCVAIPNGYFRDNNAELTQIFKVMVDGKPAFGQWKHLDVQSPTTDRAFYRWWWNEKPFLERRTGVDKLTSLSQLSTAFKAPDLRGDRTFAIEAIQHISEKFDVGIINRSSKEVDLCWKNLPGAFLSMFLLCQSAEGMNWEDLMLAKDVIVPGLRLSPYLLHKYAHYGFLVQRGHRWFISESRAELRPVNRDQCQMNYCGDPSILWGLYSRMHHQMHSTALPLIEVIDKRGEIPYLRMAWPLSQRSEIEKYLRHHHVVIGTILWTH